MAAGTAIEPDVVMQFEVGPDPIENFRRLRGGSLEGGPLIKCRPGIMTLVSPSKDHEAGSHRLSMLVTAVCSTLKIPMRGLGSTLHLLPKGNGGYQPDQSYYLRSRAPLARSAGEPGGEPPDLVIEVVNTNPAKDALDACKALGVREIWVYDVRRDDFVIYLRLSSGPRAGQLERLARSRALPIGLEDVKTLLAGAPPDDDAAFDRALRRWIKRVLVPRERDRRDEET
jgi:Uma2 family endonuclease